MYYGCYSNKARGIAQQAAAAPDPLAQPRQHGPEQPPIIAPAKLDHRRRWAILIKRIYQADPLLCPKCGGTMKIIAFIEARQDDVIRKILQHCGLWRDPPARAPPKPSPPSKPVRSIPGRDPGFTCELDPDFLDHARREELDQPELPWEP